MRPSWNDYFMSIAYMISTRATCDRKKVGAVLVESDTHTIIATGYNGSPSGMPHCDDEGHEIRVIDGRESCVRTLHAESNALDRSTSVNLVGDDLYVTVIPCYDCAKRIVNAGIGQVFYAEYYQSRNTDLVKDYFESAGTELIKWEGELIIPAHAPDEILKRTAAIQRTRL